MKPNYLIAKAATAAAFLLMALGSAATCRAGELFNADFNHYSFDGLGWKSAGAWEIFDYKKAKPGLASSLGKVARFPGGKGSGSGTLTKTFLPVSNPVSLTLSYDAGWGWGAPDFGGDQATVMLLDANGNGYVFSAHRTKATWAAQWGKVTAYKPESTLKWAAAPIDGTQKSVVDGGDLQKFTVTRDGKGAWTFAGANWTGGTPVSFTDNTTTSFSQVVLCGNPNVNDIVFNNIKLAVQAK